MSDIDKLWQESKFDGCLPEDGTYYGTVKSALSKTTEKGHELFEITTVIDEGIYAGNEAVQSIWYYVADKPERSRMAMKNIRTLAERTDSRLADLNDFATVLSSLESLLPGRKVSLEQKTSQDGKYKNIYHHDVFEAELAF